MNNFYKISGNGLKVNEIKKIFKVVILKKLPKIYLDMI
jgi:hypothetical protein